MRVRQRTHALRVIWAPSMARRLLRHRIVRTTAVVAIGISVALSLAAKSEALDHQRSEWGDVATVLIVNEQVEPGELVAGSVELRELPRAVVPAGSVDVTVSGSRAKVALYPGEVVLRQRVTSAPGEPHALPIGTVALTVPIVRLVPFLADGDLVDLWTVDSANFSSRRVAANVVVLAFTEDEITVAVREERVGTVTASSLRPVTITLIG